MIKVKLPELKIRAIEAINSLQDKSELYKIDLTKEFYSELNKMIKNNEIIIIQINGKMRLGKSTAGFSLGLDIYEKLRQYKKRTNETFGINNIARDQHEKLNYMLDPNNTHNILITDEYNEMEDSGLNSTANQKLLSDMSNIQAGRYIHGINISPTGVLDNNTDIVIEIIEKRENEKICVGELRYRLYQMGSFIEVLIGIVRIPVGHIIETWDSKVKNHYDKSNRTKKDNDIIIKYANLDWYTKYVIRKFEKMNLVNKEGILRPRELQWIEVQYDMIKKLKPLTKFIKMSRNNSIKVMAKSFLQKKKIPTSILGTKEFSEEVMGTLSLYEDYHKAVKKRNDINNKINNMNVSEKTMDNFEFLQSELENINEHINIMGLTIKEIEEDFENKIKIKKKYDNVDKEWK